MIQITERYQKLIAVLGAENVKGRLDSPFDFIKLATQGMNVHAIQHFSNYFNLSRHFTANILNLSEPTLYRLLKSKDDLKRNHAVQLFEVSDLFLYGIDVFGSMQSFFKWLQLPNTALGNIEPQDLIEIPGGVSKVRDVIGRIEYGIYS